MDDVSFNEHLKEKYSKDYITKLEKIRKKFIERNALKVFTEKIKQNNAAMTIQSQHRINLAKKETMKKKNIKEKQLKLFNILQQKLPSEVAKETATEKINQFLDEVIESHKKN